MIMLVIAVAVVALTATPQGRIVLASLTAALLR